MRHQTSKLFAAAFLCIAVAVFWFLREAPFEEADNLNEHSQAVEKSPNRRTSASTEVDHGREMRRVNSGSMTSEKALQARAHTTAIRAILDDDPDLLRAAIRMMPSDSYLLFLGATHSLLSPAEHFEMSGRLHEQDTTNALAAFIFASHLLKSGDPMAALDILRSSGTRPDYHDPINKTWQLMSSAFISEGYSSAEAKLMGFSKLEGAYLLDLKATVESLVTMAGQLPAEETPSIRSLASYMSRRISDESESGTIIRQALGLSLEKASLEGMDADSPSPYVGLTVAEARESIKTQRRQLMEITRHLPDYEKMLRDDPQLLERFLDHSMREGEINALEWLRDHDSTR